MAVSSTAPWMKKNRRTAIRAPINPLDKSTVVSIFPKFIAERKHTIQPGYFELQPGSYENPAILVVGPSSWWKEVDPDQPMLEIPSSSIGIAESVVKDYCNGYIACNMADLMPGLFYIPGAVTVSELKSKYKAQLDSAKVKQDNWYKELVRMADTLWARSNGNPLTISDDMRLACRELGLSAGKDWMKDTQTLAMERCPACGAFKNPAFPICGSCKTIVDPAAYKKLGLQQA